VAIRATDNKQNVKKHTQKAYFHYFLSSTILSQETPV
jgi:hypothetical protein